MRTSVPDLTDRAALLRHRHRARASGHPALFLHRTARSEIEERLSEVNKVFTAPLIITGFPEVWQDFHPAARLIVDDERLEAQESAHDLVLHAMALHWANDPVGQLVQARRALTQDGLFVAMLLGGRTLHQLRGALAEAEVEVSGGLSPRVVPFGDIRDLGGLLQRAGFALPVADSLVLDVTYPSALHLMRDLRAMGETNALATRSRHFSRRAVLLRAVEIYEAAFADASGRIPASFEIIALTGWAPAPDQPRPLRPGSALTRLADALGTDEQSLDSSRGD